MVSLATRSSSPIVSTTIWLIFGGALAATSAATKDGTGVLLAVFPGFMAVWPWFVRPIGMEIVVSESGIDFSNVGQVSSEALRGISVPAMFGKMKRFPIGLALLDREIQIPARLDVPSHDLYAALLALLPRDSSPEIPERLSEYCNRQIDDFGSDRVWCCCGRERLGEVHQSDGLYVFGLSVMSTALVWFVAAMAGVPSGEGWVPVSFFVFFLGLLFFAVARRTRKRGNKQLLKDAETYGIVIGPIGMAVSQDKLLGEITWDQIQNVFYPPRARFFDVGATQAAVVGGIQIQVEGATLTIANVYDRSLDCIHQQILRNWRRPQFE